MRTDIQNTHIKSAAVSHLSQSSLIDEPQPGADYLAVGKATLNSCNNKQTHRTAHSARTCTTCHYASFFALTSVLSSSLSLLPAVRAASSGEVDESDQRQRAQEFAFGDAMGPPASFLGGGGLLLHSHHPFCKRGLLHTRQLRGYD